MSKQQSIRPSLASKLTLRCLVRSTINRHVSPPANTPHMLGAGCCSNFQGSPR
jgi:hypothetical protein